MCGICGSLGRTEGLKRPDMLVAMSHRGPDDEGTFEARTSEGVIWLGHRRLAIVGLGPCGHQPMQTSTAGSLVVVFNGEIYNHAILRDQLRAAGYSFEGGSDTEVLLAAWKHWGEAALDRISGMFAFAMWDRESATLWLARDRMGEKPLYYHINERGIVFASEIRTLLRSGLVDPVLDPDGLESFLAFGSVSQPLTMISGVRMLPAGHLLVYRGGTVILRQYWTPDPAELRNTITTRQHALILVRRALDEAIQQCMVSDVPVGVLLSGGVDSSAMVARLTALGHRRLATFSVGFSGRDELLSEIKWAQEAARRYKTVHNEIQLSAETGPELLRKAMGVVDQPSVDGFNHYLVFQAIAGAGLKVAITGQGADELFCGYSRHSVFHLSRSLAMLRMPERIRGGLARAIGMALPGMPRLRKSVSLFGPGHPTALAYAARHLTFTAEELQSLLGRKVETPLRFVPLPRGDSALAGLYDLELRHFLRNQLLRDGDQMSMAVSLELRSPFVDHKLVELVTALPTRFKVDGARQKPLLVEAIGDPFVTAMSERPKAGFPFPLARWLAESAPEYDTLVLEAGFDLEACRRIVRNGRKMKHHLAYFTLLVLASWMRANDVRALP